MREEFIKHLECPITLDTYTDPVVVQSGHTIDKPSVQSLIDSGQNNPMTRARMSANDLKTPNLALKNYMENDGHYELKDMISGALLTDPVIFIGSDGHSFNRTTLQTHPDQVKAYLSNLGLPNNSNPVTNFKLQDLIEEINKYKTRLNLATAEAPQQALSAPHTTKYADDLYAADDFQKALDIYESLKEKLLGDAQIHCLQRAAHIKAKFSKHQSALEDLKIALNKSATDNAHLPLYLQMALDANQICRILATYQQPRHYFETAIDFCKKALAKTDESHFSSPKVFHLIGTLIEDQIWAIEGLCDYEPAIVSSSEKENLLRQKRELLDKLKNHISGLYAISHPLMSLKKAQYHFLVQDHQQAIMACNIALENPEEAKMEKEDRIKLRLQLALSLSATSQHKQAIEQLQAALMLNPSHRAALKAKAVAHIKLGEFAMAVQCCDISLRSAPRDNPMLITKAWANKELGKLSEAQDALICLVMSDEIDKKDQAQANSLLHQILLVQQPRQDLNEPQFMGRTLITPFVSAVQSTKNLNNRQLLADADTFRQGFLNAMNERELKNYLMDIFKATAQKKVVTGLALYQSVFMMKRATPDDATRSRYDVILKYIEDIQMHMRQSASIMWNEPTCQDYAQQQLIKYDPKKSPENWVYLNSIKDMISPNNGTRGKTPGGVVAQSYEMDSFANIHSKHLRQVVEMLTGNGTFVESQQKAWQENITQMLLGNPSYPSMHEYYLAFTALKRLSNTVTDVNKVLDNIDQIEKGLFDAGALDAKTKTCKQFAQENIHRATPRPGANDPSATPSDYKSSGGSGVFGAYQVPASRSEPQRDYTTAPYYSS